ncbi:MAG: hypothetical protein FJX76_14335 [Armatimonadetes bacterium]|nr:hypothetical protein [Armatimonadota bacterium]
MIVFSSLDEAQREGFRWQSLSRSEKLHIVEMDRMGSRGQRVKALAFACLSTEELAALETEEAAAQLQDEPAAAPVGCFPRTCKRRARGRRRRRKIPA